MTSDGHCDRCERYVDGVNHSLWIAPDGLHLCGSCGVDTCDDCGHDGSAHLGMINPKTGDLVAPYPCACLECGCEKEGKP